MNELKKLKKLFPVSKTYSFALLPVWKTLETINRNGFIGIAEDESRTRPVVISAIDEFHRKALADIFSSKGLQHAGDGMWRDVIDAWRARKADKEGQDRWKETYYGLEQMFLDVMAAHPLYGLVTASTPSKILKEVIVPAAAGTVREEAARYYASHATILQDYQKARTFLYKSTKKGSPFHRAVMENMPRFEENIRSWNEILDKLPGAAAAFSEVTAAMDLRGVPVEAFFDEDSYGLFLTEPRIAVYNALINGWNDGKTQHKGLRAYILEAMQQDKTLKLPDLQKLHHQILSGRETLSYIPRTATSDDDVWNAIDAFFDGMRTMDVQNTAYGVLSVLAAGGYDTAAVSIDARDVAFLSNVIFDNWRKGKDALRDLAAKRWPTNKDKRDAFMKKERFCLDDLDEAFADAGYDGGIAGKILDLFVRDAPLVGVAESEIRNLRDGGATLDVGKKSNGLLADALYDAKRGYRIVSLLGVRDEKKAKLTDARLLEDLDDVFAAWGAIIPVMNLTRSWCTRKPYSNEKVRLYLNNSRLLSGWSWGKDGGNINTSAAAFAWIEGKLHLLIRLTGEKKRSETFKYTDLLRGEGGVTLAVQEKMDCMKAFPSMLCAKVNRQYISITDEDVAAIKAEKHKQNKTHPVADMALVARMIGFMHELWDKHPSFRNLSFPRHDPSMYNSWNDFVEECSEHAYLMTTKEVSLDQVKRAVDEGRMLCFSVYSKDLERMYKGYDIKYLPSIHLVDAIRGDHDTKLCGGAALYFRKKSIDRPVVHKTGSFIVDKRTNDEKHEPIPEKVWKEIYLFKNGRLPRERMSAEAVKWLESGRVTVKQATFDIVKDYSFTVDRFLLHVPVTLQCSCDPGTKDIAGLVNGRVDEAVAAGAGRHIIGINRGENNLLYVVVTDPDGRIVEQRSLNVVGGMDYGARIMDRVRNMRDQQRRWEDMDRVSPIKEGYVASVLPEIYKLILKYDALVAIENLDMNFTNSRAQLGQTIYRKFENMLLDKLSYLVPDVKGAPYEALQLSPGAKQTKYRGGVVYLMSPWATSGLDPKTGWLNMLPIAAANTADKKRALFGNMDSVTRDGNGDWHLSFDYANYGVEKAGIRTSWTVTSAGERLERISREVKAKDEFGNLKTYFVADTQRICPSRLFDDAVGGDFSGDLKEKLAGLKGDALDTAVRALTLTLQTRNCIIGDTRGRYVSPVEGSVRGFDTDSARDDEPLCTDAVTAYNLARKLRFLLQEQRDAADGKEVLFLDGDRWLTLAQSNPMR